MNQPIRVAVLGYGLAGRVFHCPFVSAIPGLQLAAIVQRHGDEASQAYTNVQILRSTEEALSSPEVDLIIVATPNETHESLALAALRAGKHVVCDKPMAPSSEAIAGLMRAARDGGKLLFPFHNRRWDGDFLTLQQVLAEGKLGRVAKAISQWDRFRPFPREGTWKEAAGDAHGILQDLGPHLIDQALVLFGSPHRLTADVRRIRKDSAIEDYFDLTLEFEPAEGGVPLLCQLGASIIAADAAPRFRVHGTSGSFSKCGLDPQEAHLVADGRRPPTFGSSIPWLSEPETEWGTLTTAADPEQRPAELTKTRVPTLTGDYRLFYANVRDAVLGQAKPAVTAADAFRVARIIELARESSRQRRTLDVDLAGDLDRV